MQDYLNLPDGHFDDIFNIIIEYTDKKCDGATPEWTHIPAERRAELKTAYTAWYAAYTKTIGPHTPVDTEAKNEAKDAAKAKIRPFVNLFLRDDQSAVTDMDRTAMSIPNRDKKPTHHPVPDIKPETEAVPSGKGRHTVIAMNTQTKSKKKPALVSGVAFAHRVRNLDEPKIAAQDMPSDFQLRTARYFQWTEEQYGKIVDYATAYENEGGKRGPWSDIVSVIIA
ncbi:MAG: hypothetical protein LBJ41_08265 [Treponema sp.]|jgi:hypothetical protein|nr:hypothetical protein [Treponema sp.]